MEKFLIILIISIGIILGIFVFYATHNQNSYINPIVPTSIPIQKKAVSSPTLIPNNSLNFNKSLDWVSTLSAVAISSTSAIINTSKGEIAIQLYSNDAPKTVTNFVTLSKYGYYNNLTFHRVVPGFVIQGGDPNGDGTGGVSIYGKTFADELNPNTPSYKAGYQAGVVAMANSGPNTNGSQFFIMLADNTTLPKNYTIFGKVTQGIKVVKQITAGDKILGIKVE